MMHARFILRLITMELDLFEVVFGRHWERLGVCVQFEYSPIFKCRSMNSITDVAILRTCLTRDLYECINSALPVVAL